VGVESKTGRLLWEYPFPHKTHNQNMPTPSFHNGQILVGGENRGFHAIAPKLKDGKWTVQKNWSQREVALDMSSAIVADGLLFGMSHYKSGQLFCLDPKNGKILWAGPPRVGNNVAFLSVPGYVLALINSGEVRIIKATGQRYEQVASYRIADGGTWAPPVLLQRGILVKDREHLALWVF
jgi:outer membrane protein assembly factor BamB